MPKISLLIVDSKLSVSGELKKAFELRGYEVASERSGAHALRLLTSNSFDLMLLDLEVSDCNGIELLKTVRKKCSNLLIVIKTARATLESTLTAIKYGVNDYLIEPLEVFEIESAVENVLQKKMFELNRNQKILSIIKAVKTLESENSLQGSFLDIETSENKELDPAISLDSIKRQFVLSNSKKGESLQVELTSHEFDLLSYLMQFPGKVLSSRELALNTLDYSNISESEAKGIIRPHISRLRKKIETNPDHPDFIRTIRGRGYVFSFQK
jgi:DNA-binding response OmpR family regulator